MTKVETRQTIACAVMAVLAGRQTGGVAPEVFGEHIRREIAR